VEQAERVGVVVDVGDALVSGATLPRERITGLAGSAGPKSSSPPPSELPARLAPPGGAARRGRSAGPLLEVLLLPQVLLSRCRIFVDLFLAEPHLDLVLGLIRVA